MSKRQTIERLNDLIDRLILSGKTNTPQYARLVKLHYTLTH